MTEDSNDIKHLEKIELEMSEGFLKGWEVIFT
jgi:hypothetical protein